LAEGDTDGGGKGDHADLEHGKSYVCQEGAREEEWAAYHPLMVAFAPLGHLPRRDRGGVTALRGVRWHEGTATERSTTLIVA
jgi:hypothetical protein